MKTEEDSENELKKKKRNNIKEIKTFIINKNKDSFPVNENKNKRTC